MAVGRCNTDRDRLRMTAHRLVKKAIKAGDIPPPTSLVCADCRGSAYCYDHRDYHQPMLIAPVCKACNNRRGPGLPLPTRADNAEYKLDRSDQSQGWNRLDGGEGYEPLSARLLIDAAEAMNQSYINDSWWSPNRFFKQAEIGDKTWKARADWFKARDPWCV